MREGVKIVSIMCQKTVKPGLRTWGRSGDMYLWYVSPVGSYRRVSPELL